jgi:hypothetical protein
MDRLTSYVRKWVDVCSLPHDFVGDACNRAASGSERSGSRVEICCPEPRRPVVVAGQCTDRVVERVGRPRIVSIEPVRCLERCVEGLGDLGGNDVVDLPG